MFNFIMYHTEIGICRILKLIATKNATKKPPNVRAHCVAEPDANQRRKLLRRPDTNPTQGKMPSGSYANYEVQQIESVNRMTLHTAVSECVLELCMFAWARFMRGNTEKE